MAGRRRHLVPARAAAPIATDPALRPAAGGDPPPDPVAVVDAFLDVYLGTLTTLEWTEELRATHATGTALEKWRLGLERLTSEGSIYATNAGFSTRTELVEVDGAAAVPTSCVHGVPVLIDQVTGETIEAGADVLETQLALTLVDGRWFVDEFVATTEGPEAVGC